MYLRELTAEADFVLAPPTACLYIGMPGDLRFPLSRVTFSATHHVVFEWYGESRRMTKQTFLDCIDRMFDVDGGFDVVALLASSTFFINRVRLENDKLVLGWTGSTSNYNIIKGQEGRVICV